MKHVYIIDGKRFGSLTEFAGQVSSVFGDPDLWQGNLDAFNDILRGGFGTPEDGFILRWTHSEQSRQVLGHESTVAWLEERLKACHPSNVPGLRARLVEARRGAGPTLFDEIVEIIRIHGPNGAAHEDGVDLELL